MNVVIPEFDFAYDAGDVHYGRGRVADLGSVLGRHGVERALVVCGRTVGSTPTAIDPVVVGLGLPDRLRDVPGLEPADLRAVAEHTLADRNTGNRPRGFDPAREGLEAALDAAW